MGAAKNVGTDEIYRCDTLPPPDGEDSAYSAATKVGEMPSWVLEAMRFTAPSVGDEAEVDSTPPPCQSGVVTRHRVSEPPQELRDDELEEIGPAVPVVAVATPSEPPPVSSALIAPNLPIARTPLPPADQQLNEFVLPVWDAGEPLGKGHSSALANVLVSVGILGLGAALALITFLLMR
jgi:hypothetical protein